MTHADRATRIMTGERLANWRFDAISSSSKQALRKSEVSKPLGELVVDRGQQREPPHWLG
jgi:hypothetical protein